MISPLTMTGINIYDLFRKMEQDDVLLSFKGEITEDLLASVYRIIENRLENDAEQTRLKKKFYNILVECLQNVYHHMIGLKEVKEGEHPGRTAIFMITRGNGGVYRVITGNFIRAEAIAGLKQKLDYINSLTPEDLRKQYLEQLGNTELSEKGTAGLGFIDMARKSGEKLEYDFRPVTEELSFFSLAVTVH
jgi:hypothetical protein